MKKNVSKTTTKYNAIKVLSVALLVGLSVIGSNPASADSTYSTLNDALVDATTPRSYTVSQEGETLSRNQDTVAAGVLKISGVSSETPSVLDASGSSIFNIANETNLILKDLDIKNALSNTNGAVLNITNSNATVEISNVNFSNNKISATGNGNYGGVIHNDGGHITTIAGNFTDNSLTNNMYGYGGAISNKSGTIDSIKGNFKNNYVTGVTWAYDSQGGAIYNKGTINKIEGIFDSNSSQRDGGAIANDGYIEEINAQFINNSAISTSVGYAGGGAIANGRTGTIDKISGLFKGNLVSKNAVHTNYVDIGGAAIENWGVINSITADFIENKVINEKANASVCGVFYNSAKIGDIKGDFKDNMAISGGGINGGVIANWVNASINSISGNFTNNSSIAGTYINGSVISNLRTIESISGVISNNYSKAGTYNYGTIFFNRGNIQDLNVSFLNNTGIAGTHAVGILANHKTGNINSINGNFIGNTLNGNTYSNGAGILNSGVIGSISGKFINNSILAKTYALGGALFNQGTIDSISGSFIGNSAKTSSDSQLAFGGAVYSNNVDLNFVADNVTNIFSGNYTEDSRGKLNNAIFVRTNKIASSTGEETFYNPTVTFNAKNNGQFVINDTIDGGEINSDYTDVTRNHQYNIKLTGDKSGKITINNNIYNANISQLSVTSFVNDASQLNYGNSLAMSSGVMNINHLGLSPLNLKSFSNSGTINLNSVDINPATETMGRITADNYGTHSGTINVNGLNILSDPKPDKLQTNVLFADSAFANTVKYNGTKEYVGKIYKYSVGYSPSSGEFQFVRGGGSSGGASAFNPSILNTSVNSQAGTNATVNETFKYVFEHADAFTQLPSMERFAKINENKYALSTDFNSNLPSISSEFNNKAGWFRPYVTFEKMNLRNASAVNATTYGSLVGFDSDFQTLKHGWTGVTTGYIGYTGSQLRYSGSDTTMNGGLLGLTQTFYKGNFWTALTATTGASAAQSTTMYGKEDFTTLFAGIGSKTGYNFEFKEGKYIVQPIWFMSYTMGKTFDYTNAAGVRIDSSPMHSIMLNPSVRFITNTRSGWQPYASVGMVWNAMSESNVKADGIRLPETSIKPYVEYGVGLQKRYKDDFIAFGQAMVRNGGRNGISLTAGFRWAIGKNKSNNPIEKVQGVNNKVIGAGTKAGNKTVSMKKILPPAISVKIGEKDSSSQVQHERKVIKQLSKITKQYQNTTETTYIGELRQL